MKLIRWPCFLSVFVTFISVAAPSQAGDPVTAFEELLAADKTTDIARHYPVAVEDVVRNLQGDEKTEAARLLVMKQKLGDVSYLLRGPGDGGQGGAGDANGHDRFTITLLNSFVSGTDALIITRLNFPGGVSGKKVFSLRLEAGEWRIIRIGQLVEQEDFESDTFIRGLLPAGRNEMAAEETLGEIYSALAEYNETYRNTGFPSSLAALSAPTPAPAPEAIEKPDVPEVEPETSQETDDIVESPEDRPLPPEAPEHSYQLHPAFMKDPAVKDGYVFHYKLIDPGAMGKGDAKFQITATPVQYGKTGNKSYFIDQTSVIRFTKENRDANENDDPLNDEQDASRSSFQGHRIIR